MTKKQMTKKQEECPYCQDPFGEITNHKAASSTMAYEDGKWIVYVPKNGHNGWSWHRSGGFKFNYCPMCGRKLRKNNEY